MYVGAGYALQLGDTYLSEIYAKWILRTEASPDKVATAINDALREERIDYAQSLVEVNADLGYPTDPNWQVAIDEANSIFNRVKRSVKHFGSGAATGDADNSEAMMGAVVADMTVVGDVRDLVIEGNKMVEGEEPDMLMVSLSTVGVATTVYPVADVGVSVTKAAVRQGKRIRPFVSFVQRKLKRSIDWTAIQRAFRESPRTVDGFTGFARKASDQIRLEPVLEVFRDVGNVNKSTGSLHSTLKIMRYVGDSRSLKAAKRLSSVYGHKTLAVLDLSKGRILKAFKRGMEVLQWLWGLFVSALLLGLQLLFILFKVARSLWGVIRRKTAKAEAA